MTPASQLVTVPPNASLGAADELARAQQLHHLLVVDAGRLMGVVCRCELAPAAPGVPVAERLGEDLFVIASNASLGEALAAMRALGVGCLPVLADNLLVGILTRGDLRRVGVPRELLGAGRCCAGVAD
jgi:acetoin utilization protein AcuB